MGLNFHVERCLVAIFGVERCLVAFWMLMGDLNYENDMYMMMIHVCCIINIAIIILNK